MVKPKSLFYRQKNTFIDVLCSSSCFFFSKTSNCFNNNPTIIVNVKTHLKLSDSG